MVGLEELEGVSSTYHVTMILVEFPGPSSRVMAGLLGVLNFWEIYFWTGWNYMQHVN